MLFYIAAAAAAAAHQGILRYFYEVTLLGRAALDLALIMELLPKTRVC